MSHTGLNNGVAVSPSSTAKRRSLSLAQDRLLVSDPLKREMEDSAPMRSGSALRVGLGIAVVLTSCSSSRASKSVSAPAPKEATLAWFAAINGRNAAAVRSMMQPGSEAEQSWFAGNWAPSQWPTFTNVDCHSLDSTGDRARLQCSFDESQAPSVGNPDSFWDISLSRQPGRSWLVSSYGQA